MPPYLCLSLIVTATNFMSSHQPASLGLGLFLSFPAPAARTRTHTGRLCHSVTLALICMVETVAHLSLETLAHFTHYHTRHGTGRWMQAPVMGCGIDHGVCLCCMKHGVCLWCLSLLHEPWCLSLLHPLWSLSLSLLFDLVPVLAPRAFVRGGGVSGEEGGEELGSNLKRT